MTQDELRIDLDRPMRRIDALALIGAIAGHDRLANRHRAYTGGAVRRHAWCVGVQTRRPVVVAMFTKQEGARFAPDMMGKLVHVLGITLEQPLDVLAIDDARLGDALRGIDCAGAAP